MKKTFIYIILIINILSITTNCFATQEFEISNTTNSSNVEQPNINDLSIYSDCILMVEKETGDILYERNSNQRMYPASTTKTLTAIIVLEKCSLNDIATVSSVAVKSVPSSYTIANLQPRRKT